MSDPAPQTETKADQITRPGRIVRGVLALLGVGLIIIGVPVAIITPFPMIPIGLSIVVAGTVLVARNSLTGRLWLAGMVEQYPRIRHLTPNWLKALLFGKSEDAQTGAKN